MVNRRMRLQQGNGEGTDVSIACRPTTLLIGDWDRSELGEAVRLLRCRTDLLAVAGIDEAVRLLVGDSGPEREWEPISPELLVLAQARPGQFSDHDVARLKRRAPLARVLGLLGSWCEGEMRTGTAWPAAQRCFWYQWPARFESELDRVGQGLCPAWGLPETASLDERVLWTSTEETSSGRGTVLIAARSTATAEAVGDACCETGLAAEAVRWHGSGGGARPGDGQGSGPLVAAIWEGTQCEADEAERLAEFCAWLKPTLVVALLDFPRHSSCVRAISAGATGVVAKPFQLDDLVWQLRKAMTKDSI
jgi:hypothetical protein